jgi:hypothetical protein
LKLETKEFADAEAEVATKMVESSKPVPPGKLFVECSQLETVTMYVVRKPAKSAKAIWRKDRTWALYRIPQKGHETHGLTTRLAA